MSAGLTTVEATKARAADAAPSRGFAIPHFKDYAARLAHTLEAFDWTPVEQLTQELFDCWRSGRQVFFAGNGGSAGNANHLTNDLIYPVSKTLGSGLRVQSLAANPAVLTCLGNDEGYDNVFAYQLAVLAKPGDVLVVFSGSGNSPNILRVLEQAKQMGVGTYAVVGYSGGKAKEIADVPIHFAVNDMQIAEDTQTIIIHMIVQWLYARRGSLQK